MNIGKLIRSLRKQAGIKQKELAPILGISASYLCQVEKNQEKPSIELLARIATYFNLSLVDFIYLALYIDKTVNAKLREKMHTAKPILKAFLDYLLLC